MSNDNLGKNTKTEGVLSFDGRDNYIDCGNGTHLNLTDSMAIEVWIKLTEFQQGSRYYILGRGSRQYNYNYGLLYQNLKGNQEQIKFLYAQSPLVWQPSISLGDRQYHHLALVVNFPEAELYIDGQSQGMQLLSEQLYPHTDVPFQIGRLFGKTRFKGQMTDVRIWNQPRTSKEIKHNFRHRLIGNEPGLVGYWPLNEGSGDIAGDRTANNSLGKIEGATWTIEPSCKLPFSSPSKTKSKKRKKISTSSIKFKAEKGITEIIILRSKNTFGGKPEYIYRCKNKKKRKKKRKKS